MLLTTDVFPFFFRMSFIFLVSSSTACIEVPLKISKLLKLKACMYIVHNIVHIYVIGIMIDECTTQPVQEAKWTVEKRTKNFVKLSLFIYIFFLVNIPNFDFIGVSVRHYFVFSQKG